MGGGISIGLLVLVSATVALLLVVWFGIGRRRRFTEPCCRACLYNVSELTSGVCPECGSDLAAVGIYRPGDRRAINGWVLATLWTYALVGIALFATPLLVRLLPDPPTRLTWTVMLTGPSSQAYSKVTLTATEVRGPWDARPFPAAYTAAIPGLPRSLEVDAIGNRCRMVAKAGSTLAGPWTPLDTDAVAAWLETGWPDLDPAVHQADAAAILDRASKAQFVRRPGGIFGSSSGATIGVSGAIGGSVSLSSSSSGGDGALNNVNMTMSANATPQPWVPWAIGGFWLLIWLLGLSIVRFRRKNHGEATVLARHQP